MKKIITAAIIITMLLATTGTASASEKSDLKLAKQWAKAHYSEPIKVVSQTKVPSKRKGKTYIEKVKTVSDGGKDGHTIKGRYYVRYPKKVKKDKKVTVYMIWNPKNNASDDITAMICLGTVKGDKAKKAKKTAKKATKKATSKPVKAANVKAEPAPTEAAPQVQEPAEEMQKATPAEEIEPAPEIETCEHCEEPGKCVYWISNENRHMTPEEVEEFEYLESHYQNEAGEWVER